MMPSPIHSRPMSEVREYLHLLSPPIPPTYLMSVDTNLRVTSHAQLDIELAALLDSLSLQQGIRVGPVDPPYLAGLPTNSDLRMEADKRASKHAHYIRHSNERRKDLSSTRTSSPSPSHHKFKLLLPLFPVHLLFSPRTGTRPRPVRHYGVLKFLRRASGHPSALRVPGGPHALLRPGRGRRAADDMRRLSRAHLHPPRGVRRSALGPRGVLGGVHRARSGPGAPRLARG
jgi:hypothetical protein